MSTYNLVTMGTSPEDPHGNRKGDSKNEVAKHRVELVRCILDGKRDPALEIARAIGSLEFNHDGLSPLSAAASIGDVHMFRLLASLGASTMGRVPVRIGHADQNITFPHFELAKAPDTAASHIVDTYYNPAASKQWSSSDDSALSVLDMRADSILHRFASLAGRAPLSIAALRRCSRSAEFESAMSWRNKKGLTPIHIAASRSDHPESGPLADFLIACRPHDRDSPSSKDTGCLTPLHIAADSLNHEAIRLLLAHGATPLPSSSGQTPLGTLASKHGTGSVPEPSILSAARLLVAGDASSALAEKTLGVEVWRRVTSVADDISRASSATVLRVSESVVLVETPGRGPKSILVPKGATLPLLLPGDTVETLPDPFGTGFVSVKDPFSTSIFAIGDPDRHESVLSERARRRHP